MFKKGWAKLGNLVLDPSIVFSFDKLVIIVIALF